MPNPACHEPANTSRWGTRSSSRYHISRHEPANRPRHEPAYRAPYLSQRTTDISGDERMSNHCPNAISSPPLHVMVLSHCLGKRRSGIVPNTTGLERSAHLKAESRSNQQVVGETRRDLHRCRFHPVAVDSGVRVASFQLGGQDIRLDNPLRPVTTESSPKSTVRLRPFPKRRRQCKLVTRDGFRLSERNRVRAQGYRGLCKLSVAATDRVSV